MKRLSILTLAVAFLTLGLMSCDDEQENLINDDPTSESAVANEEIFDADFDDALDLAFSAIDMELGSPGGRVESDERMKCASRTKSGDSLIVDFGDGCEGPRGRVRKGKIIVTYTGKYYEPGSVIVTTFDNFYLNGKKLEGTRTVTNISQILEDNPKHNIVLEDGKITWPDGTFMTRETNRTRVWIRSGSPLNDEIRIFGTASGTNREGQSYSSSVSENTPLVLKRACWSSRVFIPVQGVKVMTRNNRATVTIDYGDGECDKLITITIGETTREINLDDIE